MWQPKIYFYDKVKLYFFKVILSKKSSFDTNYINTLLTLKYLKKVGIIKNSYVDNYIFKEFYYYKIVINFDRFKLYQNITASGFSENIVEAISKALGETLERYITGAADEESNVICGKYNNLANNYKNIYFPPLYHRYFLNGKKNTEANILINLKILKEKSFSWVTGQNIVTGESAIIPRQLTSWLVETKKKEYPLCNKTTNGSAGYFDADTSIVNSILEVVERDSFLCYWLTHLSPDVIDIMSLPMTLQSKIKIIQDKNIKVYILNTTTNINIPSIVVVVISDYDDTPCVALSGSAGTNFYDAIEKSIDEAYKSCTFLIRKSEKYFEEKSFVPFLSYIDQDTRMTMWRGEKWINRFNFFISGKVVSYNSIDDKLASENINSFDKLDIIKNKLKKMGQDYEPIIYKPQNKMAKDLNFVITQAFIPACFPLYLVESMGTFDSDRLESFYRFKESELENLGELIVNPWPHPFS